MQRVAVVFWIPVVRYRYGRDDWPSFLRPGDSDEHLRQIPGCAEYLGAGKGGEAAKGQETTIEKR